MKLMNIFNTRIKSKPRIRVVGDTRRMNEPRNGIISLAKEVGVHYQKKEQYYAMSKKEDLSYFE